MLLLKVVNNLEFSSLIHLSILIKRRNEPFFKTLALDVIFPFFSSAVKSTVSSQGWIMGQRAEVKQRIKALSFQAEEGKELENQTEEKKTDERMEEALKKVWTFQPETEILHKVVPQKPLPERKEWSPVIGQQREEEDEEGEKEDSQIEESVRGSTEKSEQTRMEGNEKFGTENPLDSVITSSINMSRDGSGNTTVAKENSSLIFSTTSSAGNVSTAVTLCPDGNNTSCDNSSSAVSDISTSKDRDSSDLSRSGSGLDSSVAENPLGSDLDTLARSDNKSVDTTSGRVLEPAGSVDSEGPHVDDRTLNSLQIRGLKPDRLSDRSLDLMRGLFDSGSGHGESETLPLGQFTEGAQTNREELGGPHSVGSELMHQDSPGHSSMVTVTESRYDSESRHVFDREWAKDWGLQSLGFMTDG